MFYNFRERSVGSKTISLLGYSFDSKTWVKFTITFTVLDFLGPNMVRTSDLANLPLMESICHTLDEFYRSSNPSTRKFGQNFLFNMKLINT